jgi:hypothetical protein
VVRGVTPSASNLQGSFVDRSPKHLAGVTVLGFVNATRGIVAPFSAPADCFSTPNSPFSSVDSFRLLTGPFGPGAQVAANASTSQHRPVEVIGSPVHQGTSFWRPLVRRRSPASFFEDSISCLPLLPRMRTKPHTVWACHLVAEMISSGGVPLARFIIAMTSAFLLV